MKILFINSNLNCFGGAEKYVATVGNAFIDKGICVEYFGLNSSDNTLGNSMEAYVERIDYKKRKTPLAALNAVFSVSAYRQLTRVLESFAPDIVHINNFRFTLTPSVIYATRNWERKIKRPVGIVFTAHDYSLICAKATLLDRTYNICESCCYGHYVQCLKKRCMDGEFLKSTLAAFEGYTYKLLQIYKQIDTVICPTDFMASKMNSVPYLKEKIVQKYNPVEISSEVIENKERQQGKYVLYFGRYSQEKGIRTLLKVAERLQDIQFVFAGAGVLKTEIAGHANIIDVGFQKGEELKNLIRNAFCSVVPSEWFENGSLSNLESQSLRTPVIAANIGGIPERVADRKTGLLFESGSVQDLEQKIIYLYKEKDFRNELANNCEELSKFVDVCDKAEYASELIQIYERILEIRGENIKER